MKIESFKVRPRYVIVRLSDSKHTFWPIRRSNLWDFALDLEKILNDHGFQCVMPKSIPALRENFRGFLGIEDIQIQDARAFELEHKERTAAGEHMAGGKWYMELIVNNAENCCAFDTLEELFQIVFQICMREGAIVIAGKSSVTAMIGARA